MEILVLGVKRYSFVNKETGEKVEGTKIEYVEGFDYPFQDSNMKGIFPMNVTGAYSMFDKFTKVPAWYNVEFRQRPDRNGKPVSTPVDAKFVKDLDLKQVNLKAV